MTVTATDVVGSLVAIVIAASGLVVMVELMLSLKRPVRAPHSMRALLGTSLVGALFSTLGWLQMSSGLAEPTRIFGRRSPAHGWAFVAMGASLACLGLVLLVAPIFHLMAKQRHGVDMGRSRKKTKARARRIPDQNAASPNVVEAGKTEGSISEP